MDPRASDTVPCGSFQFRNSDSLGNALQASNSSSSTPPATSTKSLTAIQNGVSLEDVLAFPIDWIRYLETERAHQRERLKSQTQMNSPPDFSRRGWNEAQISDPSTSDREALTTGFDEEVEMEFYSNMHSTSTFSTLKPSQPQRSSVVEDQEQEKASLPSRSEVESSELLRDSILRGIGQVYDYDQFSQDALGSSNW